jgi:hypothetical protein
MIFARSALLDQALSGIIENEDRERTVQQALLVDLKLAAMAEGPIGFIDENDLFGVVVHQNVLWNALMLIIH